MNSDTIAIIQRAGAALHDAQKSLAAEVDAQKSRVSEALASDAFNVASDEHFESWKSLARMAQSVLLMEEQFRQIYFSAIALGQGKSFAPPIVRSLPFPALRDVIDSPIKRAKVQTAKLAMPIRKAASKIPNQKAFGRSNGNAARTLSFLDKSLVSTEYRRLTHADVAKGVPLSLGSVGAALSSLIAGGLVEEGQKGHYKLP